MHKDNILLYMEFIQDLRYRNMVILRLSISLQSKMDCRLQCSSHSSKALSLDYFDFKSSSCSMRIYTVMFHEIAGRMNGWKLSDMGSNASTLSSTCKPEELMVRPDLLTQRLSSREGPSVRPFMSYRRLPRNYTETGWSNIDLCTVHMIWLEM
jgi:hypothetical protein